MNAVQGGTVSKVVKLWSRRSGLETFASHFVFLGMLRLQSVAREWRLPRVLRGTEAYSSTDRRPTNLPPISTKESQAILSSLRCPKSRKNPAIGGVQFGIELKLSDEQEYYGSQRHEPLQAIISLAFLREDAKTTILLSLLPTTREPAEGAMGPLHSYAALCSSTKGGLCSTPSATSLRVSPGATEASRPSRGWKNLTYTGTGAHFRLVPLLPVSHRAF
ncbi:uncharacterized protein BT62DRAFT_1012659 [Guyanagaster necrorhizus]|uniref:Uncharacterized protein n=1 Tax=Guyanagaster necrorhizus TaxID=856835 RepID=A0A9P8AN18_9AGAR|nr:uncharacterized protein BT62DRAFT_1012659 [Guyanagaster necrorhizus MCA 3950]KAG7440437.1 hypothetical protein BT62DRAFT_1012659 [Guyanagaster necrorhizus MCA 3950]